MKKSKLKNLRIDIMSKIIKTENYQEKMKLKEELDKINIKLKGKNGY